MNKERQMELNQQQMAGLKRLLEAVKYGQTDEDPIDLQLYDDEADEMPDNLLPNIKSQPVAQLRIYNPEGDE